MQSIYFLLIISNLLCIINGNYIVNCKKRCKFINTKPCVKMAQTKIPKSLDYRQNQVFGQDQSFQSIQHQDIINAIQFDQTGQYLSIGDNAGRIILFKQQQDEFGEKKSFQYFSQFQSHQPQFDSLKSYTMSQSISQIKWLRNQGRYKKMITSNNNRIKLWKMFQKSQNKVILTGQRDDHLHDFSMPLLSKQQIFKANAQIIFPIKHNGTINQINVSKNQQYIFSTDEQQAMMWNLQKYDLPFIVQQTKHKKNWNQGQKITCSKLHPISESMFLYGTSKGRIELNDLRISLNNRNNLSFSYEKQQKDNNYFTEMTSRVGSLQFLQSGKYVVSRDYLSIKIWDLCRPSTPLDVIYTNEYLKDKLCTLFQKDCVEDQFKISSLSQNLIISGSYQNRFNIMDPLNNQNVQYQAEFDNKYKKKCLKTNKNPFPQNFNYNRKISKCAVHQSTKKISLASLNSFFIFTPQL